MNYKVGDVVRIKSREWIDAQEKDADGHINCPDDGNYSMTPAMREFAGRSASVVGEMEDGSYELDITGDWYMWEPWMFEEIEEEAV
jgi:hypothetical protein